jgi:hypothetical protein
MAFVIWGAEARMESVLLLNSFIHQCLYDPLLCPGRFFQFPNPVHGSVELLGQGISLSQDYC